MQDRHIYEWAIVRLVPKVERGEFINIGVILYSRKKNFLAIKYHIDTNRLELFSEEIDVDIIRKYLQAWEIVCKGGREGGKIGGLEIHLRFRWLTSTRSTIIQCSKVHSGLCSDPQIVLDQLFEKYVL
ncbi:MAG: DUF3037 domain-containing protein [Saprospiraceae bacterium]|nr:DUF3037 domain-containing protein [Saprospiraceae bacterium]